MKQSKFSESQIVAILREGDAGVSVAEILRKHGIQQLFIQPGKPNQNAFIERFNRSYRTELLNLYLFETIDHVQQLTDEWLHSYNHERPHDSLGRVPPLIYMPRQQPAQLSTFNLST